MNAEQKRLEESNQRRAHWKRWGPYVSDRAWGTVREDYSQYGNAWEYLPHDQARSKAYRWNEDGIAGICDRHQYLCFSLALWNGRDPILKERFFGLTGNEGNHGEDVKEYYFYLDSTPTHSYMKFLYKYGQGEFPYTRLVEENRRRTKADSEFELMDTGTFGEDRYFDVVVEYAKATPEDILIRIKATNRGPDPARLDLLPTLWFRNTWSFKPKSARPSLTLGHDIGGQSAVKIEHAILGKRWLYCQKHPALLFCDNETNARRLYGIDGATYPKDAINDYVVDGRKDAVNPRQSGTKMAAQYSATIAPGETTTIRLRLTDKEFKANIDPLAGDFERIFALRELEADEFYDDIVPEDVSADARNVMRQAFAGLLWSKQFYHYVQQEWLRGDPGFPPPPSERKRGRNADWPHLYNADVISMPDKWEYPWYAAWDLAFHCVPLAVVDPDFAKEQLLLLLREWYMHPNGQLPAYEWAFGDVNPPVHAWAAWRV
jgi:hypothetical protein